MGLDIWLEWPNQTEDERKAQITGFVNDGAVGYLRSSYNDAGFNTWAGRYLQVNGFYHIFDYDRDGTKDVVVGQYDDGEDKHGFFPDWQASRERTNDLLERARQLDTLTFIRVSANLFMKPADFPAQDAVLDVYRAHVVEHAHYYDDDNNNDTAWYSGRQGVFFAKHQPTVKAVMWTHGSFDRAEPVLITDNPDAHTYYIGVLESVLAFIDLGEQKQAWMHWSG